MVRKWLTPGLGIKRWLLLLMFGITVISLAIAEGIVDIYRTGDLPGVLYAITLRFLPTPVRIVIGLVLGFGSIFVAILELNRSILAPFSGTRRGAFIDVM